MKTRSPQLANLTLALTLALTACATPEAARVSDAATTPLSDLNLVKSSIPAILNEARHHPYQVPDDKSCYGLFIEVRALDEVLGPDLDAPGHGSDGLMTQGTEVAEDAAIGALKRTAEGVVPFRSWLRKLSGAERHSAEVASAIMAGGARRAFLKGIRLARDCS
jgi:hypothetical protein